MQEKFFNHTGSSENFGLKLISYRRKTIYLQQFLRFKILLGRKPYLGSKMHTLYLYLWTLFLSPCISRWRSHSFAISLNKTLILYFLMLHCKSSLKRLIYSCYTIQNIFKAFSRKLNGNEIQTTDLARSLMTMII